MKATDEPKQNEKGSRSASLIFSTVVDMQSGNEARFEVYTCQTKSRHQAGLCSVATDRGKPRDFISFLPEPAKLVPPFALG